MDKLTPVTENALKVLDFMIQNNIFLGKDISVKDLKKSMGLSEEYFEAADNYLTGQHYVKGSMGGDRGVRYVTPSGIDFFEANKHFIQPSGQDNEDASKPENMENSQKTGTGMIENRKVFVVHGHDHGMKETVARFLELIDLEPVILHEQANEGRTIIEKFEDYSDVSYAIVLLTPDDLGRPSEGDIEPSPRARQNVIFEFGYFIGKLGRDRVCGLKRGNVEILSDYSGVLYIDFDASGTWKLLLIKEMKAVGFEIDANKAL